MPTEPIALVREFLARHNPPLQIWRSPAAAATLAADLGSALPRDATVLDPVPGAEPVPQGPAVPLLCASELAGPQREPLMAIAQAAWPGRPVICGGTHDKDVLLDAINEWRVFHLLPEHPSRDELVDALTRAHRACALEHAANHCVDQLRDECRKLTKVLDELEHTRDKLLRAVRITTAGGFQRALEARLEQHIEALRILGRTLDSLPADPRRNELLACTFDSIQTIESQLAELLIGSATPHTDHPSERKTTCPGGPDEGPNDTGQRPPEA